MSQSSVRSNAFLQEMGIGVQWKLRDAPQEDGFAAAVQALADGEVLADEAPAAPVAVAPQPAAAEPAQPAAPAVAPAAPVRPAPSPVAAPVAAPDEASTAWFDDAPMPAPTAAPVPRPAPAPAQRPAQASAPSRPAPRGAIPADVEPADEDTSWFDDAPMPPAAAPTRALPVSEEAIAEMDWPALQAAVSSCTRCTLCETRRAAVNGRGAENARWIALAGVPSQQDEQDAQAVSGEAGQLLNNMLKAIELKPESDVYITNVVKCRPPERHPAGEEVIACRPFLERELALSGATMAITFGQFAARGLMMGPAARGKVMHYGANKLPVVATYHPDDLLAKPEDKAKAWADLCLAKASHA